MADIDITIIHDPKSNVERLADVALWTVTAIGAVIIFQIVGSWIGIETPRDATDSATERSGMDLLTDHGTGCQYLFRRGAITARMGADGRQVWGVSK